MNETAWIFTGIAGFGIGYGIAHFVKKMGELAERWGFFVVILFPLIVIYFSFGAAWIADFRNTIISIIFALGFIIRMFKKG